MLVEINSQVTGRVDVGEDPQSQSARPLCTYQRNLRSGILMVSIVLCSTGEERIMKIQQADGWNAVGRSFLKLQLFLFFPSGQPLFHSWELLPFKVNVTSGSSN